MSKNSIAQSLVAWENALANVKANAPGLPDLGVYAGALEKVLADAKELSAQLESQTGKKQQLAKDRQALMKAGTVAVARLRAALKAHYGFDSERLIDYGARPVRPRVRKTALVKSPEKAPKPQVAPEPAGTPDTKAQ
jgi:hypothetical protein